MSNVTDFAVYFMFCLFFFLSGYGVAIFQKGITINVNKGENLPTPKKVEYNESMVDKLPAEVQQYYASTQGKNDF